MRRCAISIPSNIAEGRRRGSKKDYCNFLSIAFGSGAELETQLEIAKRLGYMDELVYNQINSLLSEVMRMLNKMISSLKK
jgi:four helix bundle protein